VARIYLKTISRPPFRFSLLLALTLFSLPLGIRSLTNAFLILVVLNSLFSLRKVEWRNALHSPLFWLPALFYGFNLFSLLWSCHPGEGFSQLSIKNSFVLAPLLVVAARHRYLPSFRDWALKAFLMGNIASSLYALAVAATRSWQQGAFYRLNELGGKQFFFSYTHLAEPVMHPGYFATFLGFGIFICIYFISKRSNWPKWVFAVSLSLFFVMMVLLQARMNLLALLAVLGGGAVWYVIKSKAFKWLWVPLVPLLVFVLFLAFGPENLRERYLSLPDFSYDISGDDFNSATYRLAEWSCAFDVIEEKPLLGTGLGDNRIALWESYRKNEFWVGLKHRYNAHNQYLEIMLATGIVGLLLFLALCGYFAWRASVKSDHLVLACLSFFLICLLTESMLERSWAILLFTSFFPLMLCLPSQSENKAG